MPALWLQRIGALLVLMLFATTSPVAEGEDNRRHGEYLVRAGNCFSCHTAAGGQPLTGGRAIATPFGTFYSPNITPDPETGIGRWTDAEFLKALREGLRPDGANYFPVFPYPSFTGITDNDALAIKAYLFSLPPVRQDNPPHNVRALVTKKVMLGACGGGCCARPTDATNIIPAIVAIMAKHFVRGISILPSEMVVASRC